MTRPRLSILIPFYRDNPAVLLSSLSTQRVDKAAVEVRIMDDGTGDPALTERAQRAADDNALPTILTTAPENRGRSATRNALQAQALADWVLFLDADMRIDNPLFLQTYLDAIEAADADGKTRILFGGFTVEDQASDADTDLHRVLSQSSDCLSAAQRERAGAQFVASSNLCVHLSVLREEPFDDGFSGWGWEDSEWAARVSKRYTLRHLDNPLVHLGLESTETLLSRFAGSGPNYHRFHQAHPELVESLPLYRLVTRLAAFPGQSLMQPILKIMTRMHALPTRLRVLTLKLWRASHYAQAFK